MVELEVFGCGIVVFVDWNCFVKWFLFVFLGFGVDVLKKSFLSL